MATIVITGASSGLGAEMARQFAWLGHTLVLCARRQQNLHALKDEIEQFHPGARVHTYVLDVTDPEAVSDTFHQAHAETGGLDRIIINAGIGHGAPIGTGNPEPNRRTIETNVLGTLAQAEAALEIFRDQARG
ncbi:MAG TPA: SDR family NAD(P)-dependent oxidoreductase, partial [Beutenbergiaceae bacterium]|nr:SDR family NAD(P)-dependent oxidoreductase [Beutenbergiaceae bacterium]